ncbi:MAG: methylamine dehydrogenase light chain [Phenylobacterium sp.]|uniref:methylamine dehydrogenase light chain n=1 Tax=Phenylobacterium sp. TaxID=1871053 RepID=UPI0039192E40
MVLSGARASARRHGRRSALAKVGGFLVGGAVATTLPFDRAFASTPAAGGGVDDDKSCDYWRYCALDGFLCTTAGGTKSSCPVGAEASLVSWVGTCHNPGDKRDYMISYYDCCGKTAFSGAQFCLRSEGERPGYSMGLHNDINWCMSNANKGYHCTVALVVGVAE